MIRGKAALSANHECHLCGEDLFIGKNFKHRRQRIEYRLLELNSLFAIDLCALSSERE